MGPRGRLRGARLAYRAAGPSAVAVLDEFARPVLPDGPYEISGTLDMTESGVVDLEVDEGSKAGTLMVSASGRLGTAPDFEDADLGLSLAGDSLANATSKLVPEPQPDRPFRIETRLTGQLVQPSLTSLSATVGESRLEARGELVGLPSFDGSDATLELKVASLSDIVAGERLTRLSEAPLGELGPGALRAGRTPAAATATC